jgi:Spy/CpxP family protein refolding chaperone
MKKTKKIRIVATIILSLLVAVPAILYAAQQGGLLHKPCIITRWDMLKLMIDLNITEQQETALKDIEMQTAKDIEPIIQQMDDLGKQMTATFLSAEIDTAQAESQISEMILLNSQIADKSLHSKLQEAQVLTPEQRATLLEFTNKIEQCVEDLGPIPSLFPNLAK